MSTREEYLKNKKYNEERTEFHERMDAWLKAGQALVDVWDGEEFHADEAFPLHEDLAPPMSLDEWFIELREHYRVEVAR